MVNIYIHYRIAPNEMISAEDCVPKRNKTFLSSLLADENYSNVQKIKNKLLLQNIEIQKS